MDIKKIRRFAGLMEDYLDIPSITCETIETKLLNEKYEEVLEYVVDRREYVEKENLVKVSQNTNFLVGKISDEIYSLLSLRYKLDTFNKPCTMAASEVDAQITVLENILKEAGFPELIPNHNQVYKELEEISLNTKEAEKKLQQSQPDCKPIRSTQCSDSDRREAVDYLDGHQLNLKELNLQPITVTKCISCGEEIPVDPRIPSIMCESCKRAISWAKKARAFGKEVIAEVIKQLPEAQSQEAE